MTTGERIRRAAVLLSALAADGLAHSSGEYDLDRYRKMADIADELLSAVSGHDASAIRVSLGLDGGYVTPKVDVRGALFDNRERVLLIRERTDGRWSLPGGWADPGDSPARAVQREMLEESGHPVRAVKLVGCWDRGVQWHLPALSVAVYKLFFLCGRVRAGQLHTLLEHHRNRALPTLFD
ncbi:MAG: NUDIX hydrolase [Micrococcales bacterium]|nr:MAG: NUDIX hydrolase [Micrococcales bacterium]